MINAESIQRRSIKAPMHARVACARNGPYGLCEAAPLVDYRRARTSTHSSSTSTSSTHSPAPPTASANSSGVQTKNQRLPRGMSSAHPVTPLILTDALMGAPDLATRASSSSASAAWSRGRWIKEALAHTASKEADISGSDRRSPSTTGPWALARSMKLRFRSTPTPRWPSSARRARSRPGPQPASSTVAEERSPAANAAKGPATAIAPQAAKASGSAEYVATLAATTSREMPSTSSGSTRWEFRRHSSRLDA